MTDINRMKKADNGSIITGTAPIGNGRLKENFSTFPKNNTLNDANERKIVLKKEKMTDIKGFKDSLRNKETIPPTKSKKIPTKNKITVFTFGGI